MKELSELSDEDILREFRLRRDQDAFGELMRRRAPMVFRVALSAVGEPDTAEDIVQTTFLMLAHRDPARHEVQSVEAWLVHLASRLGHRNRQRKERRTAREKEAALMAEQIVEAPDLEDSDTSDAVRALRQAIGELSDTYRLPLILHHLEGKSYQDAAGMLGCSVKTISVRLTRGREMLRKRLDKLGVTSVTLETGLWVGALGRLYATEACTDTFVASTCKAVGSFVSGKSLTGLVSPRVEALTKSALSMRFWDRVKTAVIVTVAGVALVAGGALAVQQALARWPRTIPPSEAAPPEPHAAVAEAGAPRKLSPEDAWLRELLARAEAGPWDALDFGKGAFAQGNWRMDARGNPAERLLWNVNPDPRKYIAVVFDRARWKRGVLTGRIKMLGAGTPTPVSLIEEKRPNPQWSVFGVDIIKPCPFPCPIGVLAYTNDRNKVSGPCVMLTNVKPEYDVWQDLVMYLDMGAKDKPFGVYALWPGDRRGVPAASGWQRFQLLNLKHDSSVGFGLMVAPGCRVVATRLKFVPLGSELPPPPKGLEPP